jgi:D-alanine-D-alanine ligase
MKEYSNKYGRVVVIMGGDSPEREISLIGGNAVYDALRRCKVDVHKFDYAITPISELIAQKFDRAVVILHGQGGEDGALQGLLEVLKIPYTGSGILASSIAMDKYRTKLIWGSSGIPMAKSRYLTKVAYIERIQKQSELQLELALPVIVKPNYGGSTLGITVVYQKDELKKALDIAFMQDDAVLIEEFIVGDEYTVVISEDKLYPIIKIEPPKQKDSYDYQDKYFTNDTNYVCSPDLGILQESIEAYAKLGYEIIGARGIARADFMISKSGQVYFLEINTIPGMTSHSFVPMAFSAVGIDFDELCLYMLSLARLDCVR